MFSEPIKSINQAKDYFRAMGCSHFHMSREFPQRYKEYKQLKISKEMENEWVIMQLDEYFCDIMENKQDVELWIIHSRMAELVETLKTDVALNKMLEITQHIRNVVPLNDRVIISETINGRSDRQYRSGLIYLAYDLNNKPIAKEFAKLSLHFAVYDKQNNRGIERFQSASKLCNNIIIELGL